MNTADVSSLGLAGFKARAESAEPAHTQQARHYRGQGLSCNPWFTKCNESQPGRHRQAQGHHSSSTARKQADEISIDLLVCVKES